MDVLLTNDDGFFAPGLLRLAEELSKLPRARVYAAAPSNERSACGHAVTLYEPLYAIEKRLGDLPLCGAWTVSGTPADCVKLAVGALLPRKPDVVVSGINNGVNLGPDVFYSGTVSAAIEAAFLGIPAIAVSREIGAPGDYDQAAQYVCALVAAGIHEQLPPLMILNVNVPAAPAEEIKEVRCTGLGITGLVDGFDRRVDPRGRTYFWLTRERVADGAEPDSDVVAIRQRAISVTPVNIDLSRSFCPRDERLQLPEVPWS